MNTASPAPFAMPSFWPPCGGGSSTRWQYGVISPKNDDADLLKALDDADACWPRDENSE